MIISHKHKFIFFKTRKTASSSIQVALAEHCGPNDIITGQYQLGIDDNSHTAGLNLDKFYTNHPHPELSDVRKFVGENIWNSYFKFAIVRNPYDIAVSRYHWDLKGKKGINNTSVQGFKDWVKEGKLFPKDQSFLYTSDNSGVCLDFIGYYENLEEDITVICNKIGINKLNLPKLKSGFRDKTNYKEFYDEDTKNIVSEFFKNDIYLFGYNFENKNIIKRGPLITSKLFSKENENIGTPSLIKVPNWVKNKLGKYYLYFSNHQGTSIKMGYSNSIEGPWTIEENIFDISQTPCSNHIASPEVVIDNKNREILMYYHGDLNKKQGTFLAKSKDGINFINFSDEFLCHFYLRIFKYKNKTYGIAKKDNIGSIFYDLDNNFEPIFELLPKSRHCYPFVKHNTLYLFYSLTENNPEHIRLCTIQLHPDLNEWEIKNDKAIIFPTYNHEGSNLPQVTSYPGSATLRFKEPIRELRDPFLFEDEGNFYILYVTKGEREISYAKLIDYIDE